MVEQGPHADPEVLIVAADGGPGLASGPYAGTWTPDRIGAMT